MAKKRQGGRKIRVDFRRNRQAPQRRDDWTRRFQENPDEVTDNRRSESVRAKGDLSRKRTIIVDENDLQLVDERDWRRGVVTSDHGLYCRVDELDGTTWDCTVRRVLRTLLIEQRANITVGDHVWFSDHAKSHSGEPVGVVERVEPRKTKLSRRDRRKREHTIVANADQLLIVTSIARPSLKPHLIDRYLVAAARGDLRPVICFNKCDLAPEPISLDERGPDPDDETPATPGTVDRIFADFESLGYRCIRTSATTGVGLDALQSELHDHMTVLSGQSGVGKSSLLNAIQPDLRLTVQEVSNENDKGRHTTTLARLLRLDVGGYVVDTPGIRQFDLWDVPPNELEACFVEFLPLIAQCRFNDCHHTHEEGCAIADAARDGRISPRRYLSYLKMIDEVRRGGGG